MEELIAELLLVENVWCQKQSWSFMNLLQLTTCSRRQNGGAILWSCCWGKMYGVKGKVGHLWIYYVVEWLVLVYGEIWGQLKKSTPPPLFPLRRSERHCCSTSVRLQVDGSFHFHWWRAPVPLRPSEGEEGGRGALFQMSPNFAVYQNQPYHYIANS